MNADSKSIAQLRQFANTPEPPYYAVVFSSQRTDDDQQGYAEMAQRMLDLAQKQAGYLGVESARDTDGFGITVSYWDSLAHIAQWKNEGQHLVAQDKGRTNWYQNYFTRIAKVERAYSM